MCCFICTRSLQISEIILFISEITLNFQTTNLKHFPKSHHDIQVTVLFYQTLVKLKFFELRITLYVFSVPQYWYAFNNFIVCKRIFIKLSTL
ncbi:hypothetical protein KUTeg_021590 [Tegillarca granosa]|uniref:Uncharacterized protein n=1 Tax=Tegillarca granosa TaxID=220873 RepID=A0ABQ9E8F4_TEGGR|nr:hypothetical protein KUTeg_021590 [Tegillarca granosa]